MTHYQIENGEMNFFTMLLQWQFYVFGHVHCNMNSNMQGKMRCSAMMFLPLMHIGAGQLCSVRFLLRFDRIRRNTIHI